MCFAWGDTTSYFSILALIKTFWSTNYSSAASFLLAICSAFYDISVLSIYYFLMNGLLWAVHSFLCSFTFLYQHLSLGWKLPLLCWKRSDSWHNSCQSTQNFYGFFFLQSFFSLLDSLTLLGKIWLVLPERVCLIFDFIFYFFFSFGVETRFYKTR